MLFFPHVQLESPKLRIAVKTVCHFIYYCQGEFDSIGIVFLLAILSLFIELQKPCSLNWFLGIIFSKAMTILVILLWMFSNSQYLPVKGQRFLMFCQHHVEEGDNSHSFAGHASDTVRDSVCLGHRGWAFVACVQGGVCSVSQIFFLLSWNLSTCFPAWVYSAPVAKLCTALDAHCYCPDVIKQYRSQYQSLANISHFWLPAIEQLVPSSPAYFQPT